MRGEKCLYCQGWVFQEHSSGITSVQGMHPQAITQEEMYMIGSDKVWDLDEDAWSLTLPPIKGYVGGVIQGRTAVKAWSSQLETALERYYARVRGEEVPPCTEPHR